MTAAPSRKRPTSDSLFPSSLGLTFSVGPEAASIRVTVRWGRYERRPSERVVTETGRPKLIWKRLPVEAASGPIPFRERPIAPWTPQTEQPAISVLGKIRKSGAGWVASVFLVNGRIEPEHNRDESWLFQPEIVIDAPDGAAIFVKRAPTRDAARLDPPDAGELAELPMMHRRRVELAVGHGVAVHAETAPGDPARALRLSTRVMPSYDVAGVSPPSADECL